MTTATALRARLMSESFAIRDDKAACDDCDWTWDQPATGKYEATAGGRAAKKHALDNGHITTIRRVQFTRHFGLVDS